MADKEQDYKPSLAQRWKKFSQVDESGMSFPQEVGGAAMRGFFWYDSKEGMPYTAMLTLPLAMASLTVLPLSSHNEYSPTAFFDSAGMESSITQGYQSDFGYRAVQMPDGQTIMVVRDENDVWRVYQERAFDSRGEARDAQGYEEITFIEDSAEAYAIIRKASEALQGKIDGFKNFSEGDETSTHLVHFSQLSNAYEHDDDIRRTTRSPNLVVSQGENFLSAYQDTIAEFEVAGESILEGNYGFQPDDTPVTFTERPDNDYFNAALQSLGFTLAIGAGMGALGTTINTPLSVMRRRKRHKFNKANPKNIG